MIFVLHIFVSLRVEVWKNIKLWKNIKMVVMVIQKFQFFSLFLISIL